MKRLLSALMILLLMGCSLGAAYQMKHELSFFGVPAFPSAFAAMTWVHSHIQYRMESDFQSPETTLSTGIGDCKAMSALLLYILHEQGFGDGTFVVVTAPYMIYDGKQVSHAIVKLDGNWYDPITGGMSPKCPYPTIVSSLSYANAIGQSSLQWPFVIE